MLQVDVYLGGNSGEQECYKLVSIWVGAQENRNATSWCLFGWELRRMGMRQVDVYVGGNSGEQECYKLVSIWVGAQ